MSEYSNDSDREAFEEERNERILADEYGLYDYGQDDYDPDSAMEFFLSQECALLDACEN